MTAQPAVASAALGPAPTVVAWEVDLAAGGTITYSVGAAALFGHASLPASLARFAHVTGWIHEDDVDALLGLLERALGDGTLAAEFRVRGADGRWRWIELRGALLRDRQGRAQRALGIAQDITVRRDAARGDALLVQLDEALRGLPTPAAQARAASGLLAQALGVDCVLWAEIDADEDHGVVLGAHPWPAPGLEERLRLSHFGPALHEAARQGRVVVHEDTASHDGIAAHRAGFETLGARAGLLVPRREGGRLVGVLAAWQAVPRRWRDAEVALVRRVAERCGEAVARTRTELALRESEQRFRELADSSPLLIWIGDPQGGVRFANRAFRAFFGLDEATVSGRWRALVHPDDAAAHDAAFRAAASERRTFRAEARMRRADGQWRWIESQAVPRDGGVHGAGMVGCSIDVTERRRAEQALRDADRRKDEFLATLAHELRNPLAPITHALDLLGRGGAEDTRALLEMMRRQVRHTVRLVDDLLEVSRIARGKLALRREPVQLAALLRDAIEACRPLIESAHHTLEVSVPREPLWLHADALRLTQVLCNLLNNAAKYTEPGGTLVLEARRAGAEVVVAVRDDGIGLSAALLPRVFDMFTQGERVTHRSQGGLGIGLALARRMVELHGGRITAESPGLNQGSTFTVVLPLGAPPAAAALVAAEPVPLPLAGRVLVADDNRDAADALAALLRTVHTEVEVVYDGLSALAACERASPWAVVADVGMPGLDGYELAQRLRTLPGGERVLLVALTGWSQDGDRRRSERAGFDHHLVKPADFDALLALLAAGRAAGFSARAGTARPAP